MAKKVASAQGGSASPALLGFAQNTDQVAEGYKVPNKATACRQHIKLQPVPLQVQKAYDDFYQGWQGTPVLEETTISHYRFYVNELKVETSKERAGAFSGGGQDEDMPVGEPMTLKIEKNRDNDIPPEFLIPLKTNTGFDVIISKRGGPMPGTVNMITGESGAGKTSTCVNIATWIKRHNKKKTAGMLQGEMNRLDWAEECEDNKQLDDLDIIFLLDYLDAPNFFELVEEGMRSWDFVIVDSFEVILQQIKEARGWTGKRAESELINLLNRIAETGKCLFVIQHYTKGGTYAGSSKLKHLTTSMIFVMFEKGTGERYITIAKNRRAGHMVNKKLYFTKSKVTGELEYDIARFNNDQARSSFVDEQKSDLATESAQFMSWLEDPEGIRDAEREASEQLLLEA